MTNKNKPVSTPARPVPRSLARLLLLGTLILLLATLAALAMFHKTESRPPKPPIEPTPVSTIIARINTTPQWLTLPGRLEPFASAVLSAEKPGGITQILVDRGSTVTNGQLLACLDDRVWNQARRQALAEKDEADRDLARWSELHHNGAVADRELESMSKRRELAAIALDQALVNLSLCRVTSPFNGLIEDKFAQAGEYATEGKPLLRVVDVARIKLTLSVPEREAVTLAAGMPIPFHVHSRPGVVFTAVVSFVSAVADPATSSFDVEAIAPNPDLTLKGGMLADVQIARPALGKTLQVPLSAIIPRAGEHVAFTVKDGHARLHVVHVAALLEKDALVSQGIEPDDEVIVDGNRTLDDGAAVLTTTAQTISANPTGQDR